MHPTMKNPNAPRIVTVKAVRRESLKVVVVDLADWHARNIGTSVTVGRCPYTPVLGFAPGTGEMPWNAKNHVWAGQTCPN